MKLEKLEPFVWRIPQDAVPGMRVPGIVFATEEMAEKAVEDRAVEQVANVATLPGIVRASYAMPDIHWGYGFPIGGVAATDVEAGGVVSPGGVGFDIACGVRLVRSELEWERDVKDRISDLVHTLGQRVPRGIGTKGRMRLSRGDMEKVLREGVRFPLGRGVGWEEDAEFCEDHGVLEDARPEAVSDRAIERGAPQLGSLGAGNHFLEVQVVEEVFNEHAANAMGLFLGQVCVMLHSGSRGMGHQTCTDFLKVIDRVMAKLGIEVPDRQLACVPVEHEAAQDYLGAMYAAANFARANRHVLTDGVRESFEQVLRRSARDMGLYLVYDVAHNLAKIEEYTVDGERKKLCVHRKGATRAFGPHHPELPARYAPIGQPVIIPGSMGTASYVLVGTEQATERSFSSTCHGAGRAMSRTKARKMMTGPELRTKLEGQGITLAASQWKLLAEEAPYAYKDVSQVVDACEGAGLSKKVARLRPVGVVKG
ncbi:MAG TPA: RtcB family protein [Actinomycetota bacterium]|jgi:tRNA-splicing ligase RtcB|nr:RtcB family protein [Actinomycetota bacterium]